MLLIAAVSATAQGDGKTGLLGQYFKNMTLAGSPALKRLDAQVNFDWGDGAPAEGFPADQFSVRWSGQVQAPATGKFKLILNLLEFQCHLEFLVTCEPEKGHHHRQALRCQDQ